MAEGINSQDKKAGGNKVFATILKVILGLIFLGLGAYTLFIWWDNFVVVLKGCLGWFLVLAAIIFFAIAKE